MPADLVSTGREGKAMHRVVQTHIEAYLDGRLPAIERREVESHLRACGECAAQIREVRRTHEWMGLLVAPPQAPGPDFYARVLVSVDAEKERRAAFLTSLFPVFGRQLVMAVAMLVLLLGGFLATVYHNHRQNAAAIIMQSRAQAETPVLASDMNANREQVMRAIVTPVSASEGD